MKLQQDGDVCLLLFFLYSYCVVTCVKKKVKNKEKAGFSVCVRCYPAYCFGYSSILYLSEKIFKKFIFCIYHDGEKYAKIFL